MQNIRKIHDDLYWIGASDRRLALFENVMPVSRGVSYNSYVLLDEKTVLLDTADAAVGRQFFENLQAALSGRPLDYLVINHMEPDHCALLGELMRLYPQVTVVSNAKALAMVGQFFEMELERKQVVTEGDTLCTGRHTLHFVLAPMVHWPEAMVTYDSTSKTLFSADAFGTFGALSNLFADEVNFDRDWLDDARRYYCNIVGKYGPQVQAVLKTASTLDIATLGPLHGPVWRTDIGYLLEKYDRWSRYEPEEHGVMVVYGSMYGDTESAASALATQLADRGVRNIALYDVSHTDVSTLVGEAFRWSHLVFAAPTYNAGIYTPMENLLLDLKSHNLQNRHVALIENGTWAPMSGKLMRALLEQMKGITFVGETLTIKSALKPQQASQLSALADALVATL